MKRILSFLLIIFMLVPMTVSVYAEDKTVCDHTPYEVITEATEAQVGYVDSYCSDCGAHLGREYLDEYITFFYEVKGMSCADYSSDFGYITLDVYARVESDYARIYGMDMDIYFDERLEFVEGSGYLFNYFIANNYRPGIVKFTADNGIFGGSTPYARGEYHIASLTFKAESINGSYTAVFGVGDECLCARSSKLLNELVADFGVGTSTEITFPVSHSWSDWSVIVAPTPDTEGEEQRSCNICGTVETRTVEPLAIPVITVDNYTVTITKADNIKDMRYALGEYTTTTEIRNAEGNVAISNSLVVKNTVDGKFVYEMPKGGYYTIWIRMKDGTNHILALDVTNFTPTVSSYGVTVTLHDLYDVKDFYIAKGEYNTYREIKDNGYIFSATSAKIGTKHDYTCTVKEPGVHTILIRYNDGTQALFHEELTVDEPVFTVNGLQVTISNIPDVKVIRTAYGEYYTPGDTKRAEGARNFSNKSVIKNAESYKLQYREEGRVTIIVEYNNGYIKVFHYDVMKKIPVVEQNANTVTFGDLDGLVMIRYAMGEYSTSAEIKRAKGSKVVKPADLIGGHAVISDLESGIYTFCVQFDDESYSYLTVTVE